MKIVSKVFIITLTVLLSIGHFKLYAQWQLDNEQGLVFSGYNDVRIPNETGTKISLSEELKTDPVFFFRVKLLYPISDKHNIAILIAPLRLEAKGKVDRDVIFEGEVFPADTQLQSVYVFNSYRFTYRYDFYHVDNLQAGIGLTAKLRDASISLEGGNKKAKKTNLGFVPLINFRVQWMFAKEFSIVLDGDALASPQGRAEDILLAIQYNPVKSIGLKVGYRILEGGADVEEVYNFAMLHYILAGAIITF